MAIAWTFYINSTEVEEPKGFDEVILRILRDDEWHGVFFEASTTSLQFYGAGAAMLTTLKDTDGLAASATFQAVAMCGETEDVINGTFDFGTYKEICGTTCGVSITIEKSGCIMTMRNRYDQKVDLSKATAFNNTTLLPNYTGLSLNIDLPAQVISVGDEADSSDAVITEVISDNPNWLPDNTDDFIGYIAPALPNVTNDSLGVFNTSAIIDLTGNGDGVNNRPPYPSFPTAIGTAELLADIVCDLSDVEAQFRFKGNASIVYSGTPDLVILRVKLFRLPAGLDGTVAGNWVQEYENTFYNLTGTHSVDFDVAATVPLTISQGDFIYWGVLVISNDISDIGSFTLRQDKESFFKLLAAEACETTRADVGLVNETGARIIESITDACLTMKSDYYGRTDSEPYVSDADGCGSLRVLSNGLKIRKATPSNHFISLSDYFKGLRGIDNIGMGIEPNPNIPTAEWLRIEPVEYFYQNTLLLRLDSVPEARNELQPNMGVSTVKIGYEKWEPSRVNGLDEFNSNKEFRTGLSTINSPLDAQSPFIAGGYPIEITRQQSFAKTGAADTKYDNDTFIICVDRDAYGYHVEQGNISNATNIFSPTTAYNWRIRPMYNLMRWFKSIAQTYVNLLNTTSKLFFSSGTGNYLASGELTAPDSCKLEVGPLAENHDLHISDFNDVTYATPIWAPETMPLTYPLSLREYLQIKANPYGYLEVQCGNGEFLKYWIKSIDYKISKGTANFTLIKKWQ